MEKMRDVFLTMAQLLRSLVGGRSSDTCQYNRISLWEEFGLPVQLFLGSFGAKKSCHIPALTHLPLQVLQSLRILHIRIFALGLPHWSPGNSLTHES